MLPGSSLVVPEVPSPEDWVDRLVHLSPQGIAYGFPISMIISWPQTVWHGVGWKVLRLLYITFCTKHPRMSHACTVSKSCWYHLRLS